MRAGRDDLLYPVVVERLDILPRHHLEKEFVTRAPGRVARTSLFFPQDGIADPDLCKYAGKCPGDLLGPLIETAGATDPEQNLRAFSFCDEFRNGGHFHVEYFSVNLTERRQMHVFEPEMLSLAAKLVIRYGG